MVDIKTIPEPGIHLDPEKEKFYTDICQHGNWKLHIYDCDILDRTARAINAKTIVEIGVMEGCSTQLLGTVARDTGGHLYSFDPRPKSNWYVNVKRLNLEKDVTITVGFSPWAHSQVTIPMPIDYLFIDGEHKSRWAIVDFHYWSHFLRVGGCVAFHDIYGPPSVGVLRAISIILEDDNNRLKEIARGDAIHAKRRGGVIVFQKLC
ncbi:MAG: class I SAM-dependent methyltransferase [Smithella sp.]|jgi:predicted O-methyltransferase YrrM